MAKRGRHSFLKRQKEIKRKEEAVKKMARRQGKIGGHTDGEDDKQQARGRADDLASVILGAAEQTFSHS